MWTFVLTKLDGTKIGELTDASARKVTLSLSKVSTASFTVLADHPLLADLFGDGDTLLQVWEDTNLRFYGPIVSVELATQEDSSQRPTVNVTAADPGWRLSLRLAGKSLTGTTYTAEDKAQTAADIITATNSDGATGVKVVSVTSGSTGTYTAGPYVPVLSCIGDLAHGTDGFDWYMTPLVDEEPYLAQFDAAAVMGSVRSDTLLEFGAGLNNVATLNYTRDISGMANSVFHLPDGLSSDPGAVVVNSQDSTSITDHGLYELVADASGIQDATLRNDWTSENVAVRRSPRRVVAASLDIQDNTGRVPVLGTDYWLGDFVRARAVVGGIELFDGSVRIYRIQVELNDAGTATITPILIDDDENL